MSEPLPRAIELVGGPQDGKKVHAVGGELPDMIYVGPRDMGDGYAAWGRERSGRFPACYERVDQRYYFRPAPAEGGGR